MGNGYFRLLKSRELDKENKNFKKKCGGKSSLCFGNFVDNFSFFD